MAVPHPSPPVENRSDCPTCKKFSRGVCGPLFVRWMDCIDAHPDDATRCDDLVRALDTCLTEHRGYYDAIDVYDEEDRGGDNGDGSALRLAWRDLIDGLTEEDGLEGTKVRRGDFDKDIRPEMEIRPRDGTGVVRFRPNWSGPMDKETSEAGGGDRSLLVGYVEDQDGELLGAGSAEDLFWLDEDGTSVLRFRVEDGTKDVTACALYGYVDGGEGEELFLFRMTRRMPSNTKSKQGS